LVSTKTFPQDRAFATAVTKALGALLGQAAEVAAVPGAEIAARQDVLRTFVSPELVALFEERLPATALRLAEDRGGLTAAVGLYHMVSRARFSWLGRMRCSTRSTVCPSVRLSVCPSGFRAFVGGWVGPP